MGNPESPSELAWLIPKPCSLHQPLPTDHDYPFNMHINSWDFLMIGFYLKVNDSFPWENKSMDRLTIHFLE
jgi:hypothetical protein